MSAENPSAQPAPSWRKFILQRAGHYSSWATILTSALILAIVFIPSTPGLVFVVAMSVTSLISAVGERFHDGALCDQCIEEIPVDVHWQAHYRAKSLRRWHWMNTLNYSVINLVLMIVIFAVMLFGPEWIFYTAFAVSQITPAYAAWMDIVHSRLVIACPWCEGTAGPHVADASSSASEPD